MQKGESIDDYPGEKRKFRKTTTAAKGTTTAGTTTERTTTTDGRHRP